MNTTLLSRLDGVRETGRQRWIARCPAHEDRTPSLSIRELPDGRLLVFDFGGCHVADILAALSLSLSDLYPDGVWTHDAPPSRSRIPAADLLLLIERETLTVGITAARFLEQYAIAEDEWQRLALAICRISAAADYAREVRR